VRSDDGEDVRMATYEPAGETVPSAFPRDAIPTAGARDPRLLPGLSVVLPCYDEAANVAAAVHAARRAAARVADACEVVVVDDGSGDETAAIAAAEAARDARVRVVRHERNRGYGAAVRTGIEAARMPWVLLTDADLQFDLDELDGFLPWTAEADLVIGWRIDRRDPFVRRANAAAWNWLVQRVFGLGVRDVDCAFKLMRRDLVAPLELTCSGAMISTELLVRARARGARVRQVGVHHRPRVAGEQSGARPRVVARALRELTVLHRERPTIAG
jgi:Glycosyl transferase family 2